MTTKNEEVEVKVTSFNIIPGINLYTIFCPPHPLPAIALISVVLASRGGNVEKGNQEIFHWIWSYNIYVGNQVLSG